MQRSFRLYLIYQSTRLPESLFCALDWFGLLALGVVVSRFRVIDNLMGLNIKSFALYSVVLVGRMDPASLPRSYLRGRLFVYNSAHDLLVNGLRDL